MCLFVSVEWCTPEVLQQMFSDPVLQNGFSDPGMSEVMTEMSKNPAVFQDAIYAVFT